jgi:hypothetical protein
MLNLDKFQADTYTFNLVLPDGTVDETAKITVRGDSHPEVKALNRKLLLESESRRATKARKAGKKDIDHITEDDLEYLEEVGQKRVLNKVESMKGIAIDGKEVGTDKTLIAAVLKQYEWIAQQVMEEAADVANFCS